MLCNKLGFFVLRFVWNGVITTLGASQLWPAIFLSTMAFLAPPFLAALAVVLPEAITKWHRSRYYRLGAMTCHRSNVGLCRRHRLLEWDSKVIEKVSKRPEVEDIYDDRADPSWAVKLQ
jgi:hypothetical protein